MRKFYTKNGRKVGVPASTLEHMMAHSDVDWDIVAEAISKIRYNNGFHKESVELGRVIGKTQCVEVTDDDEIIMLKRKNRKGPTPFVLNREAKDTSKVVIIIREGHHGPVLLTSWYGDLAPMEPWDARRKLKAGQCSEEDVKESDIFWSNHALVLDNEEELV